MNKCSELLPDYFGFVKGLVDSPDLSLNISREMLQHDRQLKIIAKNLENKIKSELQNMLKNDREEYEKFFNTFGMQLKYGTYNNYGMDKDKLKDLLMFYSSTEKKLVTLGEYVSRMKEGQDTIYYASGESVDKIDMLPQVDGIKDKEYEILYLTENVDEFVMQVLQEYEGKKFANVCADNIDLESKEEKEELEKVNEENKSMFEVMKEAINSEVQNIRFTHKLKNHPVCLTSEGAVSIGMEKTLNAMPNNNENIKAQTILEINKNHPIVNKLKEDNQVLSSEISNLNENISKLTSDFNQRNTDNTILAKEVINLRKELKKNKEEKEVLQASLVKLNEKVKVLSSSKNVKNYLRREEIRNESN